MLHSWVCLQGLALTALHAGVQHAVAASVPPLRARQALPWHVDAAVVAASLDDRSADWGPGAACAYADAHVVSGLGPGGGSGVEGAAAADTAVFGNAQTADLDSSGAVADAGATVAAGTAADAALVGCTDGDSGLRVVASVQGQRQMERRCPDEQALAILEEQLVGVERADFHHIACENHADLDDALVPDAL